MHRNIFSLPRLQGKSLWLFSLSSFFPPSFLIPPFLSFFPPLLGLLTQPGLSFHVRVWLRKGLYEAHSRGWQDSVPCGLLAGDWPRLSATPASPWGVSQHSDLLHQGKQVKEHVKSQRKGARQEEFQSLLKLHLWRNALARSLCSTG